MSDDRLRRAFDDLAGDAPAGAGVLERAQRQIVRHRARRRVAAGVGAVAAIALVIGGMAVRDDDTNLLRVETPPAGSTPATAPVTAPDDEVVVPNVIGLPVREATAVLESIGLSVETQVVASDDAPSNTVVAQSPDVGTPLTGGGTVSLPVTPAPSTLPEGKVPDVAHLSLGDATNALEALDLGTDTTGIDGPATPDSEVTWQEPPAGAAITTDTVKLWTCNSECPPYPADWYAGDGFANTPWHEASLGAGDLTAPSVTELVDRVVGQLAEGNGPVGPESPTLSTRLVTEEDGAPLLVVSWRGYSDDSVSGADFLVRLEFDGSSWSIGTTQTREICARGDDAELCV